MNEPPHEAVPFPPHDKWQMSGKCLAISRRSQLTVLVSQTNAMNDVATCPLIQTSVAGIAGGPQSVGSLGVRVSDPNMQIMPFQGASGRSGFLIRTWEPERRVNEKTCMSGRALCQMESDSRPGSASY